MYSISNNNNKKKMVLLTLLQYSIYFLYPDTAPFNGEPAPDTLEHDFKKQTPDE